MQTDSDPFDPRRAFAANARLADRAFALNVKNDTADFPFSLCVCQTHDTNAIASDQTVAKIQTELSPFCLDPLCALNFFVVYYFVIATFHFFLFRSHAQILGTAIVVKSIFSVVVLNLSPVNQ